MQDDAFRLQQIAILLGPRTRPLLHLQGAEEATGGRVASRGNLPALVVATCLAAVSCGTPAALSRAEFLARADSICEDAQRDLASGLGEFPQEVALDTLPGFAQGYGAAIPILERELDDMRALPPPREQDVDRFLDSQEANIGALKDARGAALKADLDGFQRALGDALDAAKEFRAAGAALGLRSCGRPVTAGQGAGPSPNASGKEDPLPRDASHPLARLVPIDPSDLRAA